MATQILSEKFEFSTTRPSYKAYRLLQIGFVALPFIAGLDKFFYILTNWSQYLSPIVSNMMSTQNVMRIVGLIEMAAALIVAFNPRVGGYIVAGWLGAIIVNLLSMQGYYDIALRDLGLLFGALTLAWLSAEYHNSQHH